LRLNGVDLLGRSRRIETLAITPVSKTLRFDSADVPEMVGKTEGMALLGDGPLG